MLRRKVLSLAVSAGMSSALLPTMAWSANEVQPTLRIIDTNISLFQWPFRRLPLDQTDAFVNKLRFLGISQAWACSFEGMLNRDIAGVNERLAADCKTAPDLLIPCGAINPMLPDWEEDLRRCIEQHGMRIVRLTPGYHGYDLAHDRFRNLAQLSIERNVLLQIVVRMEDERTQPPLLHATDVDLAPLEKILPEFPAAKLQFLNALHSASAQQRLQRGIPSKISFDIGTLEGAAGISRILKTLPPSQLCFGSHFPFFTWESAELKLRESALPQPTSEMIGFGNAKRLFEDVISF